MTLEGTYGDHLIQAPSTSKATENLLPRTMPRQLLNISNVCDSITSLDNLCRCSVTLTGKKWFLIFRGKLLHFSLCPSALFLSLGTTGKSLGLSSFPSPCGYLCTLMRSPSAFSSLSLTVPALSAFTHKRDAPVS